MSNMFDGESLSAAYQIMDYDAVTIGNHEFDWGIENTVDSDGTMMDHSMGEGDGENLIPVIASNIFHNGEKISFADDYIILQKASVKTPFLTWSWAGTPTITSMELRHGISAICSLPASEMPIPTPSSLSVSKTDPRSLK